MKSKNSSNDEDNNEKIDGDADENTDEEFVFSTNITNHNNIALFVLIPDFSQTQIFGLIIIIVVTINIRLE